MPLATLPWKRVATPETGSDKTVTAGHVRPTVTSVRPSVRPPLKAGQNYARTHAHTHTHTHSYLSTEFLSVHLGPKILGLYLH